MIPLAETAAPTWLPAIILLVPVGLIAYAIRRGMAVRSRVMHAAGHPLVTGRDPSVRQGEAKEIADGGVVPFMSMLAALSVVDFESLGDTGYAGEDPWTAALGLHDRDYGTSSRSLTGLSSQAGRSYHLADGIRDDRQVVLRRGDDESAFGFTSSARHNLHQLLIRAEFPSFELTGAGGVLSTSPATPDAVLEIVAGLAYSDAWSSLHVIAGPEGIVFVRPTEQDLLGGFVYDLWLGERLATALGAPALSPETITRSFHLPYGAGRAPSRRPMARTTVTH
jgi:hypothetical protein